jgi:hypothetical protein
MQIPNSPRRLDQSTLSVGQLLTNLKCRLSTQTLPASGNGRIALRRRGRDPAKPNPGRGVPVRFLRKPAFR